MCCTMPCHPVFHVRRRTVDPLAAAQKPVGRVTNHAERLGI